MGWSYFDLREYCNSLEEKEVILEMNDIKRLSEQFNSDYDENKKPDSIIYSLYNAIKYSTGWSNKEIKGDYVNQRIKLYPPIEGVKPDKQETIEQEQETEPEPQKFDAEVNAVSDLGEIGSPTKEKFHYLTVLQNNGNSLIPNVPQYISRKIGGNIKDIELLTYQMSKRRPILLIGHASTGKNHLVDYVCMMTNRPCIRFPLNGGTEKENLVGSYVPDNGGLKWKDGLLTLAVKKGYTIILDEINAAEPEVLFVIHALCEEDDPKLIIDDTNEVIRPHSEFRVVATMNPSETGQYGGTKDLNSAFKSRFFPVEMNYLSPHQEARIIVNRTGLDSDKAKQLAKLADFVRSAMEQGTLRTVVGTRDLTQIADLVTSQLMSLREASKLVLTSKATIYEKKNIEDTIDNVIRDGE